MQWPPTVKCDGHVLYSLDAVERNLGNSSKTFALPYDVVPRPVDLGYPNCSIPISNTQRLSFGFLSFRLG
jgi:hypothetical protein